MRDWLAPREAMAIRSEKHRSAAIVTTATENQCREHHLPQRFPVVQSGEILRLLSEIAIPDMANGLPIAKHQRRNVFHRTVLLPPLPLLIDVTIVVQSGYELRNCQVS